MAGYSQLMVGSHHWPSIEWFCECSNSTSFFTLVDCVVVLWEPSSLLVFSLVHVNEFHHWPVIGWSYPMFESDTSIHMVGFLLWLDWDEDEDPGFHLINLICMDLLSIHDCTHDPFYSDGCADVVDPYIWSFLVEWLHPCHQSIHIILSIRMVVSMPWIHIHDPF